MFIYKQLYHSDSLFRRQQNISKKSCPSSRSTRCLSAQRCFVPRGSMLRSSAHSKDEMELDAHDEEEFEDVMYDAWDEDVDVVVEVRVFWAMILQII